MWSMVSYLLQTNLLLFIKRNRTGPNDTFGHGVTKKLFVADFALAIRSREVVDADHSLRRAIETAVNSIQQITFAVLEISSYSIAT